MKTWKTELTSGNEVLGEVEIKRGIFQGDTLSPLLFVLAMIPLKGTSNDKTSFIILKDLDFNNKNMKK